VQEIPFTMVSERFKGYARLVLKLPVGNFLHNFEYARSFIGPA